MWSIHNDGGTSGAKETAMNTTRFERRALPTFFMAGWVVFFGVIENAQAQPVNPVPPPPPPVFNPATPNTAPTQREVPVSPGLPSALPGSQVRSPSDGSLPSAAARTHRRAVSSATTTSKPAKARGGRHSPRHRHWSRSRVTDGTVGTSYYYYSALGWGYGPYPCVWRRGWDGHWWHACY